MWEHMYGWAWRAGSELRNKGSRRNVIRERRQMLTLKERTWGPGKNNRPIVKRSWEVNSNDHRRLDHTWCQWTWGASDEWWSRIKEVNEVWKVTCLNFHKKFGSYDSDEETELSLRTNNSSVAQRSWEGISRRRTEGDTSLVIHRTMQTSPIGWGRTGYWWNL